MVSIFFQQRVINVSNAPPVSIKRKVSGSWEIQQGSGGLVACVDPVMSIDKENIWLANIGMNLQGASRRLSEDHVLILYLLAMVQWRVLSPSYCICEMRFENSDFKCENLLFFAGAAFNQFAWFATSSTGECWRNFSRFRRWSKTKHSDRKWEGCWVSRLPDCQFLIWKRTFGSSLYMRRL